MLENYVRKGEDFLMLKAARIMAAAVSVWAVFIVLEIAAIAADAEAPSCGGFGGGGGSSAGAEGGGGMMGLMFPLAIFVVIFYFFIIRPQKKRQKQQDNLISGVSKGDQIVTIGGFFGTVHEVKDDGFVIELAKDIRVKILKSAVSTKIQKPAQAEDK